MDSNLAESVNEPLTFVAVLSLIVLVALILYWFGRYMSRDDDEPAK
jgi:uncharacterized membrane protein